MPLKEGQILETEDYNFVLGGPSLLFFLNISLSYYFIITVRADKNSKELIAVQIDILLDYGKVVVQDFHDNNQYLFDDMNISTNLESEDLLKTDSTDWEAAQMMMNSDEIECVAKQLIEDVIACAAKNNLALKNTTNNSVIDISNFTAKNFFDSQNFHFDTEFKNSESLDLQLVKTPAQVERGQKFLVFESDNVPLNPIMPPPKKGPLVERRMPKFNKRSKFVSELRAFEAQLVNIPIEKIDDKYRLDRKRKQDLKSFVNVDLEIIFCSDDEHVGNNKKPRQGLLTYKKGREDGHQENLEIVGSISNDKPVINSDQDFEATKHVSSLRCSYCQKIFITTTGLNTHMKHCPKLASKLSEIIDESCSCVPETGKVTIIIIIVSFFNTMCLNYTFQEEKQQLTMKAIRNC